MSSPLMTFFQLLKRLMTAQRKILMLKHGYYIQNQRIQINEKKTKKNFTKKFHVLPPYRLFLLNKIRCAILQKFPYSFTSRLTR